MITFDAQQARKIAADLNAQLDRCENGEGMECASLDAALTFCAKCCCKLTDEIRQWARDVFAGRVAYDAATEQLWKAELLNLYQRATREFKAGDSAEMSCYDLPGKRNLYSSLWVMHRLIASWVSPALAVGPSARGWMSRSKSDAEQMAREIDSLPPLAPDWMPLDAHQAARLRRLGTAAK